MAHARPVTSISLHFPTPTSSGGPVIEAPPAEIVTMFELEENHRSSREHSVLCTTPPSDREGVSVWLARRYNPSRVKLHAVVTGWPSQKLLCSSVGPSLCQYVASYRSTVYQSSAGGSQSPVQVNVACSIWLTPMYPSPGGDVCTGSRSVDTSTATSMAPPIWMIRAEAICELVPGDGPSVADVVMLLRMTSSEMESSMWTFVRTPHVLSPAESGPPLFELTTLRPAPLSMGTPPRSR